MRHSPELLQTELGWGRASRNATNRIHRGKRRCPKAPISGSRLVPVPGLGPGGGSRMGGIWGVGAVPPHTSVSPLQDADDPPLRCFHPGCPLAAHPACLAREFLREEPEQILPVEGRCPGYGARGIPWGRGDLQGGQGWDAGHWTEELQT
uniref:Structure-specific endonuclease subunit SLX1 C-terminal domain-containing protein n=1 Tax=Chrysemys picta bellii TaxID=8478 RepID=A0A8C3HF57_CHRPI